MIRAWLLPTLLLAAPSFAADVPIPAPPQIGASSYLLMDFSSGRIIVESRADERVEPASLTKLMTAYAIFHALRQNQISLEDEVHVSEKAWRTEGSRMFIEVDTTVSVAARAAVNCSALACPSAAISTTESAIAASFA